MTLVMGVRMGGNTSLATCVVPFKQPHVEVPEVCAV